MNTYSIGLRERSRRKRCLAPTILASTASITTHPQSPPPQPSIPLQIRAAESWACHPWICGFPLARRWRFKYRDTSLAVNLIPSRLHINTPPFFLLHIVPVRPDSVYTLCSRMVTIDTSNLPTDVPAVIGEALSILLYGILVVQAFIYYTRFSNDSKWMRHFSKNVS
ncbi:hypothetical protein OG21DRAFT_641658 [Imleria badia]|nr:hypothetical protein OG21DRAFT_641658 [Imleria badia]